MNRYRRMFSHLIAVTLTLLFSISVFAQSPADLTNKNSAAASATISAASALPDTYTLPDAPAPNAAAGQATQYPTGTGSGDWRVGISIYGWFPGVHGTVGVLGHNASIHVPFSDTFHLLKGVIPIAVEADKGRFLMPIDFIWMKLGVNNAIPLNDHGQTAIDSHLTESIFTPKLGYRLLDADHLKFDALAGIRYWHVGVTNDLEPSGLSYSQSANWIDGLGGGRFILPFGDKAAITAAGDAGAGQASLDYQVVGLFNYNFTPKLGMAVGYRYLYENYRPNNSSLFVFNPAMSGAVAGLGFNFGGKPAAPLTASCATSPAQVFPGDPVTVTATAGGLNPKLNALYTWSGDGVSGEGSTATINTSALNPGTHTVTGTVKQGKPGKEGLKPSDVASCSVSYTVKEFQPPTVNCSANPDDIKLGDTSTITAHAVSPQNRPMTYSYQASSGTISGTGATATFSSAGASPGPVQITGTVVDDKGHSASCSTNINIQAPPPPPPPEVVARLRLHNIYFPTALPTAKHPEGGLVESQQETLTKIATDFKTYLASKPDARLNLIGHADPRGTPAFNQALSERRVARAKAFLVEQGVPEASIDTQAVGEEHQLGKDEVKNLIQTNPDLSDDQKAKLLRQLNVIFLAQNRRVDIRLEGSEQESSLHYPFNAADSATLLDLNKPTPKKKK